MVGYCAYTDEELIALLKQGGHAAFKEIYDRYSSKIFYQVNQMLRDADVSNDLVQDLFIAIWNKAEHIRIDAKLGGYLYMAA